jgi:hypothetical protein
MDGMGWDIVHPGLVWPVAFVMFEELSYIYIPFLGSY